MVLDSIFYFIYKKQYNVLAFVTNQVTEAFGYQSESKTETILVREHKKTSTRRF